MHDKRLSLIVLVGGITGLLTGLGLQEWVHDDRLSAQHRAASRSTAGRSSSR